MSEVDGVKAINKVTFGQRLKAYKRSKLSFLLAVLVLLSAIITIGVLADHLIVIMSFVMVGMSAYFEVLIFLFLKSGPAKWPVHPLLPSGSFLHKNAF